MKHINDFSDHERRSVCEENIAGVGPVILSQKYNTLVSVIRKIINQAGLYCTPDDLSKHPDFPKKDDYMSPHEYQNEIRKYWNRLREKEKKKKKVIKRMDQKLQGASAPLHFEMDRKEQKEPPPPGTEDYPGFMETVWENEKRNEEMKIKTENTFERRQEYSSPFNFECGTEPPPPGCD